MTSTTEITDLTTDRGPTVCNGAPESIRAYGDCAEEQRLDPSPPGVLGLSTPSVGPGPHDCMSGSRTRPRSSVAS